MIRGKCLFKQECDENEKVPFFVLKEKEMMVDVCFAIC